jgi:anion-transporting  ArsA/GET3 family ATPase
MRTARLLDARLLVVTGKGGTGKTSVAAAIAVAAAAKGHEVLLAEVEGRQGLARLFDLPALDHTEAPLAERVTGLAVDPKKSLREYLDRTGVGVLGALLDRAGLVDLVTAAAPGLGDALLIGKLSEVVGRANDGVPAYDLVVLDAPPSGRILPFLKAPASLAGLARYGPMADQTAAVAKLLTDPDRTRVVLTTLPEALPVAEARQTAGDLAEAGIAVGIVVANQVTKPVAADAARLAELAADPASLRAAATGAGLSLDAAALAALVGEGAERQRRYETEQAHLAELRDALKTDVVELPVLPGGVADADGVAALAKALRRLGPKHTAPSPEPKQLEAPKALPEPEAVDDGGHS